MLIEIERRSFVAYDPEGNRYLVVASRPVGIVQSVDRPGSWAFRTLDGRAVRPARINHQYTIEPDGTALVTSDSTEPTN